MQLTLNELNINVCSKNTHHQTLKEKPNTQHKLPKLNVIPAKAGNHKILIRMDSRLRGDDWYFKS